MMSLAITPESKSEETTELVELKGSLKTFGRELSKMKGQTKESMMVCIKSVINTYIDNAFRSGVPEATISEHIHNLCHQDMLIPSDLTTWAVQQVETVYKTSSVPQVVAQCTETPCPTQQGKPLFSDEILYHSIICCNAITTYDINSYRSYLESVRTGHLFKEVSMTDTANAHQYLIARQHDTKVIYVAFRSQPKISNWNEKYTFEEG